MSSQPIKREIRLTSEMTLRDLSPKVAALLCYLGAWITGIIFLVLEQKNSFVRFHALQSIIVFGALTLAGTILGHIPFFGTGFNILFGLLGFTLWIILMIKANQGLVFKLPWAGDLAERLALETVGSEPQGPAATTPNEVPSKAGPTQSVNPPPPQVTASRSNSRDAFREKYYSAGARLGRVAGSSIVIAWCVALLIFFNFFHQYIAYYQSLSSGGWQITPLVTSDFSLWLPILNTTLALTIAAHAIFIAYDRYLLREIVHLGLDVFGLATVISLLLIFPFNFDVIPNADANFWAPLGLSVTLILTSVGIGIGIIVRFIRLIIRAVEGKY